jgi:RHS repeat-associated protein
MGCLKLSYYENAILLKAVSGGQPVALQKERVDCYPYGSEMPGRIYNNTSANDSSYRYGFNGQEKSREIGSGLYNAEFWEYDSRIGRRWNTDPKPNDGVSFYACLGNNPIWNKDVFGDSDIVSVGGQNFALRNNPGSNTFSFYNQATNTVYAGNNKAVKDLTTTLNDFSQSDNKDIKSRASALQGDKINHNIIIDNTQAPSVVKDANGNITATNTLFSNLTSKNTAEDKIPNNGVSDYRAQFGSAFLSSTYLDTYHSGGLEGNGQTANGFFNDQNGTSITWGNQSQMQYGYGAAQAPKFASDNAYIENSLLAAYHGNSGQRQYYVAPFIDPGLGFKLSGQPGSVFPGPIHGASFLDKGIFSTGVNTAQSLSHY